MKNNPFPIRGKVINKIDSTVVDTATDRSNSVNIPSIDSLVLHLLELYDLIPANKESKKGDE